tara:strand:- start:173558 stop:175384 length:1827 start_codon:yes stop_codon:yes gene_type:complete
MDMHTNMRTNMHAGTKTTDRRWTNAPRTATKAESVSREKTELRRRKLTAIVTLFIAAGLVAALSLTANGQGATQYKKMPMHPKFLEASTVRQMETAAKDLARARDLSAVRNPRFAQVYYELYLPAKITQIPEALPEISKLTEEVTKNLAGAQRSNNPGAAAIVQSLFKGLKPVAEGDYHPAARITALSIIGRLDSKAGSTTAKRAPVPFAGSFPLLLAQYNKEDNPDGVRAAALQGLHRFVSIGFPSLRPQDTAPVIDAMQKLLDSDPPAGRDRMSHAYLQRFAVDILTTLKPADEKLGETLVSVSTEPSRHDLIALYSASKLASVGKYGGAIDNPEPLLNQWTARAMRAFQYEYERLVMLDGIGAASSQPPKPESTVIKKEDQVRVPMGGYGGDDYEEDMEDDGGSFEDDGGGYDDMDESYEDDDGFGYTYTANPQPPEVIASRRRLNHVLQQIHRGVTGSTKAGVPSRPAGLLAAAKDPNKRKIQKWAESMAELVTALNDPVHDDRAKFKEALLLQIETIQEIAGSAGQEVAAEYANLPFGLNPFTKLAVLSGEPLKKPKEAEPMIAPPAEAEAPVDGEPATPPEAVAQPPIGAAASNPTPAPTGT